MTLLSVFFLVNILIFLASHFRLRIKGSLSITDFFVGLLMVTFGPMILMGVGTTVGDILVSEVAKYRFLSSLCLMYLFLSCGFWIGELASFRLRQSDGSALQSPKPNLALVPLLLVLGISGCLALLFLSDFSAREFLKDFVTVILLDYSPDAYKELRRIKYADSHMLSDVIGRMRFSIITCLFLSIVALGHMRQMPKSFYLGIAYLVFLTTAISISKLPWVYYAAYPVVFFFVLNIVNGEYKFGFRQFLMATGGFFSGVIVLSLLYIVQYQEIYGFGNYFEGPLYSAFRRVFTILSEAAQGFFYAYPDMLPFAEGGSSSLLAKMFSLPNRNVTSELASLLLDSELTSLPSIFICNAWADFGYVGVIVVSLLVGVTLKISDNLTYTLHIPQLRAAYVTAAGLHSWFFIFLSAPTALLTYGFGLFFIFFWVLEQGIRRRAQQVQQGV